MFDVFGTAGVMTVWSDTKLSVIPMMTMVPSLPMADAVKMEALPARK